MWLDRGDTAHAGSAVAVALMLWGADAGGSADEGLDVDHLVRVLAMIAVVVGPAWGEPKSRVRQAAFQTLLPHLKVRATNRLLRFVDEACAATLVR